MTRRRILTDQQVWVRLGRHTALCFGELVGAYDEHRDWKDWPCLYCARPVLIRDWWWHVPTALYPPALAATGLEYGWCTACVMQARVRSRDVPRDMWLEEIWERFGGEACERRGLPRPASDASRLQLEAAT